MLRTRSFDLVHRNYDYENLKLPKLRGSVGADLNAFAQDRAIRTDPDETRRRRTIRLVRSRGASWGFTLQTYGIRNKRTREVEVMSYVDYVEMNGPAWVAGMRRGDIILSVNGESVDSATHKEVVSKIQKSGLDLRLVVLFEDCCKKVELHERYLKLKRLLSQKVKELHGLEEEEKRIIHGIPLSRVDLFRQSIYSTTSSEWDIYSEITSPSVFDNVPANQFVFRDNLDQSVSDVSTLSSASSTGNHAPDSSFSQSNTGDDGEDDSSMMDMETSGTSLDKKSDVAALNISDDNVFHENETNNESLELPSPLTTKDNEKAREDFLASGESDHSSQISDSGFGHLYNVTRCAQCITDVTCCTHTTPKLHGLRCDESFVSQGGSMTNLAVKSGSEGTLCDFHHSRNGKKLKNEKTKATRGVKGVKDSKVFFIESDSEDSLLGGNCGKQRSISNSSGSSISTNRSTSKNGAVVPSSGSDCGNNANDGAGEIIDDNNTIVSCANNGENDFHDKDREEGSVSVTSDTNGNLTEETAVSVASIDLSFTTDAPNPKVETGILDMNGDKSKHKDDDKNSVLSITADDIEQNNAMVPTMNSDHMSGAEADLDQSEAGNCAVTDEHAFQEISSDFHQADFETKTEQSMDINQFQIDSQVQGVDDFPMSSSDPEISSTAMNVTTNSDAISENSLILTDTTVSATQTSRSSRESCLSQTTNGITNRSSSNNIMAKDSSQVTQPAPKRRLVHGILVNDSDCSTRL